MIAMAGIWAGENLTGGQAPIEVRPTSRMYASAQAARVPLMLTSIMCCVIRVNRPCRAGSRASPKHPPSQAVEAGLR